MLDQTRSEAREYCNKYAADEMAVSQVLFLRVIMAASLTQQV
jgi:hypothetical protein